MQQRSSIYIFLLIFGLALLVCFDGSYAQVVFEETFKVDAKTTTRATYKRFIEGLRPRLGVRISHKLPILPRQQRHPTRWFDIVLRTHSQRTTLRLRRDNLYVIAYQSERPSHWWELNDPDQPNVRQVPGSTFLGFDGRYGSLARVADASVATISLGQQALINAVESLATTTARATKARSLIIVIQMISESIRFKKISDHLTLHYQEHDEHKQKPAPWMDSLVKKWGQLSSDLLAIDINPNYRFRPVNVSVTDKPKEPIIIDTAEKARAILGIILGPPPPALPKPMAGVDDDNDGQLLPLLPQGQPLSVSGDELEDLPVDLYRTNDQSFLGFVEA